MSTSHASLLHSAALAATAGQHHPERTLYVVATPIGNLADLTLRAIHVLGLVDAIACEDTRHSAAMLRHIGLEKPLLAVHEHNEHQASEMVVERLRQGQRVAYVSDAGTPAVSDPGAVLVAAVQTAGFRVLPLPGASSATTLLSAAGDRHSSGFAFVGFLPAKGQERERALRTVCTASQAQVLFEAPHRIESLAAGLVATLGEAASQRRVTIGRELTKQFETVITLRVNEWPAWLAADPHRSRGEFALVLHAPEAAPTAGDEQGVDRTLQVLLAELPLKQAVSLCVSLTGAARNEVYARALALRESSPPG